MFRNYLDLGPPLPDLEVDDLLNEEKRQELIIALDQRIKKKDELREMLITQSMIIQNIFIYVQLETITLCFTGNDIRSQLVFLESNYVGAQQEIHSLNILRDQDTNKVLNILFTGRLICINIYILL